MKDSRPNAAQTVAVLAAAIATSALLHSHWFESCCMNSVQDWLWIPTLPAILVQLGLADSGIHGGREVGFHIGLAIEFYLLFWLTRWVWLRVVKR